MNFLQRLITNCRGAAVAEYGLIAAVAGMAIAVASLALGSAVTSDLAPPSACTQITRC